MFDRCRDGLLIRITVPTRGAVCFQVDIEVVTNKFIDVFLPFVCNFRGFVAVFFVDGTSSLSHIVGKENYEDTATKRSY